MTEKYEFHVQSDKERETLIEEIESSIKKLNLTQTQEIVQYKITEDKKSESHLTGIEEIIIGLSIIFLKKITENVADLVWKMVIEPLIAKYNSKKIEDK